MAGIITYQEAIKELKEQQRGLCEWCEKYEEKCTKKCNTQEALDLAIEAMQIIYERCRNAK